MDGRLARLAAAQSQPDVGQRDENTPRWESLTGSRHLSAPVGVRVPIGRVRGAILGGDLMDAPSPREQRKAAKIVDSFGFNSPGLTGQLADTLKDNPDWDQEDIDAFLRQRQREEEARFQGLPSGTP